MMMMNAQQFQGQKVRPELPTQRHNVVNVKSFSRCRRGREGAQGGIPCPRHSLLNVRLAHNSHNNIKKDYLLTYAFRD